MTQLNVKNLDHLGIIAAVVDELGLVDYINEQVTVQGDSAFAKMIKTFV